MVKTVYAGGYPCLFSSTLTRSASPWLRGLIFIRTGIKLLEPQQGQAMGWKWSIAQKGLILISIPLAFELCFIGVMGAVLAAAQSELDEVSRSRQIVALAQDVGRLMIQATTVASAFTASGRPELKERFDQITGTIQGHFDQLDQLLKDKPDQLTNIRQIRIQTKDIFDRISLFQKKSRPGSLIGLIMNEENQRLGREAGDIGHRMSDVVVEERRLNQQGPAVRVALMNRLRLTLIAGLVAITVMTVGLGVYFARGVSRRLQRVMDNSSRLAAREPLLESLKGTDEIAELDQAFHAASRELLELERMKRGLAAVIALRLRRPLHKVQLVTNDFLAGRFGTLDQKTIDRMNMASASTERLLRLVQDLAALEKVGVGELEISPARVELAALFRSTVMSVEELASRRQIHIVAEPCAVVLEADPDRLMQVLVNLISNAIKFSPENGTIRLYCEEFGTEDVEISVSDQGPGVPAELRQKIFEKFEQVHASDAAEKGGSGLGLSICKSIVERHGGSIRVESAAGLGSTFVVRLPRRAAKVEVPQDEVQSS